MHCRAVRDGFCYLQRPFPWNNDKGFVSPNVPCIHVVGESSVFGFIHVPAITFQLSGDAAVLIKYGVVKHYWFYCSFLSLCIIFICGCYKEAECEYPQNHLPFQGPAFAGTHYTHRRGASQERHCVLSL